LELISWRMMQCRMFARPRFCRTFGVADLKCARSDRIFGRGFLPRRCHGPALRVHSSSVAVRTSVWQDLRLLIVDGAHDFASRPFKYLAIPVVAGLVGLGTNWVGVKMLFYPIDEAWGPELWRPKDSPYGLFCWQGVVPTKAEKMAHRLTDIVTKKLLSLTEAFGRLDPKTFAALLQPSIEEAIRRDAPNGQVWAAIMRPFLPFFLSRVVSELQRDVESVLDIEQVVTSAFLRDKRVLVELFLKVGHSELEFLVNSGLIFGFLLGLWQMFLWGIVPRNWTLPVAGSLVGYITNWIAIKLIFDPVEPVKVGPFMLQGLFEKRQKEVSIEFAEFLANRVLTSPRLVDELANGNRKADFEALLRRTVPFIVPDAVVSAACGGLRQLALAPESHPVHTYMAEKMGIEATLCGRLQLLSFSEFENLLHPIFEEDEIILIIVGGVLGFATGLLQYHFNFGGPTMLRKAAALRHAV